MTAEVYGDAKLPKEVRQALNGLAHAAGQSHAIEARIEMIREAEQMKAQGLTPQQIVNRLYGFEQAAVT